MTYPTFGAPRPSGARIVTVIQNSPDVPLDLFREWMTGVELRTVRADLGEPVPVDLEDVGDGLVVLGGQMSAVDDLLAPWLPATRALLAAASHSGLPTLGICLGAQLLAVARGGRLQVAAPPGCEAGVIDVQWRPEAVGDPLVDCLQDLALPDDRRTTPHPSMHADAIVDLPRGATWLASSIAYPYQAFRIGSAWGVQFHPEAGVDLLVGWAQAYPEVDLDATARAYAERADEITMSGRGIARAFAILVNERADTMALV